MGYAALIPTLKALGIGTTALATVPVVGEVVDYVSKGKDRRKTELYEEGRSDVTGKFDLDWSDNIPLIGSGLTQEELDKGYDKYRRKIDKKENSLIGAREALTGTKYGGLDGGYATETPSEYLARTKGKATKATAQEKIDVAGLMTEYNEGTPASKRARFAEEQERNRYWADRADMKNERRDTNLRLAQQRQDDVEYRLMELGQREQAQSDKMDIYRQQLANQQNDRRHATTAALISGLATLGTAFAL